MKTANETKKEAEAAIEATKKEITSLALEIAETEKEAEKPIPEPDMSGDEEYKAVCGKSQHWKKVSMASEMVKMTGFY